MPEDVPSGSSKPEEKAADERDVQVDWRSKSTMLAAKKPGIIPKCNPCRPESCKKSGPQWETDDASKSEEWYKKNIRKFIWEFSPDAADPTDEELTGLLESMKQGRASQFSRRMLKITQNTIEKRVAERAKNGDPKADYFKVYAIHERFDRYGLQMPKSDSSHPQMSFGDKAVQRLKRNLVFGRMLLKKPHVATFSGELLFQRKRLTYGENEKTPDYVGIRSAEELRGQVESITATSNGANFQFLDEKFRTRVVERIASINWEETIIDLFMPVPFPDGTVYRPAMNSVWVVRKKENEELLFYVLHSASAAGEPKAKFLGINWEEKTVGRAGQKFTSLSNAENVYTMSATEKPLTLTLESYYFNRCSEGDKPYVTITCIFDPCTKKTYDEEYGTHDGHLALLEMSLLKGELWGSLDGALMFALTENYFPDERTAAIFRQVNISERKGLLQDLQDEVLGATVNLFGDYQNFHGACWVVPPQLLEVKNSEKDDAVQKVKESIESTAKEERLKHREKLESLHRTLDDAVKEDAV
ncbi:hypothetical protein FOL47_010152 [Perkinsus chesapeaki]|uniref:Uncharacterized protein n=1 Tax=Perkinsus chesapeaki TaxID=330153 RepID=A0A7J6L3P6_PERCH|nr:hypothetical protein FOL47_010152 [Perkinsus chesapeaki]